MQYMQIKSNLNIVEILTKFLIKFGQIWINIGLLLSLSSRLLELLSYMLNSW